MSATRLRTGAASIISRPSCAFWRRWRADLWTKRFGTASVSSTLAAAHRRSPAPSRVSSIAVTASVADLHQFSERAEIEIQVLGRQAEPLTDVADRFLELHQRFADGFHFLLRERLLFHAPDCLPL